MPSLSSIFENLEPYIGVILSGLPNTLILTFGGFGIGLIVGPLLAFLEVYGPRPLARLAAAVEEVIRGIPLLVIMFLVYFGLPELGVRLDPLTAAVVSIGIRSLAYQSQIIRSAILSIPAGQWEAALALGMSPLEAFVNVIAPQAFRIAIPGLVNQFTVDLKDTSIAYAIGVAEIFTQSVHVAQIILDYLSPLLFVGLIYFILTYTASSLASILYRRVAIPGLGGGAQP
ncbi:amino acid ABC transporter permease [Hyperthermus butylicus]|uniref:Glutamate/aspartate transport system permease protein n=1 Tax=Hyperthermus butylicus (strain DSM 5456 / JCM 9403 / PLM1-5) TaxID=415426 RepID=A2BKN1_HYPBU|nr:amino acid ABC transporter permease [Hyperthermus butylicus]ABM80542.1 glutamate/aspartate transport system permease protein [Hyperthermus butylicus DSM 5456]